MSISLEENKICLIFFAQYSLNIYNVVFHTGFVLPDDMFGPNNHGVKGWPLVFGIKSSCSYQRILILNSLIDLGLLVAQNM